jgi:type III pantothenate kinase
MLLAIDVGNSNTVLGLYQLTGEAPELIADWRITTPVTQTASECGIVLQNLFSLNHLEMSVVDGIVISSVVPPLDPILRQVCELYFHLKPLFIEPGVKTGLPILTDNPSEVGADRIVNCVAAYELYGRAGHSENPATGSSAATTAPTPIIVVDLGTATTFDVISKKGEFLGGAIAPGLRISADALFSRAARLPRVDIKRPAKVIGTNTVDNMQIGLYYGYIGLVDGILARMIAELGPETRVVATGGLANLIAGGSKYLTTVDDRLTLTGLRIIYQRNQPHLRKR